MTTKPIRFRKKPVIIEAVRFTGSWSSAIDILTGHQWAGIYYVEKVYEHPLRRPAERDGGTGNVLSTAPAFLVVQTLEGDHRADAGDWIIKGVKGEFYPCKPDIFEATYEKVQ